MTPGNLSSYSDLEVALMVFLGYYGSGNTRKSKLGSRYSTVQQLVNKMIATGKVPDGEGSADPDKIRQAIGDVFADTITELTNEVMEKL